MRRIARTFLSLVALGGLPSMAVAQTPAPQPRRQAPPAAAAPSGARGPANAKIPTPAEEAAKRQEMEQLMGLWEKQSSRLTSLDVGFRRIDKSPGWDVQEEFLGHAYLQTPNLACLHFQKATGPEGKPGQKPPPAVYVDHERIVCTGTDVLQYDYATKQIFRFPLDRQARNKALEEGPLPFLFNMKAAEAKARYGMSLIDQNKDAYLIGVLPRVAQDKEVFSQAFIQLNKKTFLPDRLMLVSPDQKDTQDYTFTKLAPNTEIDPKFFQAALTIKGWKLIDNPSPSRPAPGTQRGASTSPDRDPARGPVSQKPVALPRRNQ